MGRKSVHPRQMKNERDFDQSPTSELCPGEERNSPPGCRLRAHSTPLICRSSSSLIGLTMRISGPYIAEVYILSVFEKALPIHPECFGRRRNPASGSSRNPRPHFAQRTSLMGQQTRGGLGKPNPANSRFLPPTPARPSQRGHPASG